MAKKKTTRKGKFNMSAAVRDVLAASRGLSGNEVEAELKKKYPGQKINRGSMGVAFSNARKQLGIAKGRKKKSVRKRKPSTKTTSSAGVLDMTALQAARKYVSEVGNVEVAIETLKQLKTLQLG